MTTAPHPSRPARAIGVGLFAGILLAVILYGVLAITVLGGEQRALAQSAPAHARALLVDLRERRHDAALRRMDLTYQRAHNPAQLGAAVHTIPPLATHTRDTIQHVQFTATSFDATAVVRGLLHTPSGDVPFSITMASEESRWYIRDLTVQKQPLP